MFATKKKNTSAENADSVSDKKKLVREKQQELLSMELTIPTLEYAAHTCSVQAGLALAFGNCESSTEHNMDLSIARPLVEFCASMLDVGEDRITPKRLAVLQTARTVDPVLKYMWAMFAENMIALYEMNIFEGDKDFESLMVSVITRSLNHNFRRIVDKILTKWDTLCSYSETYAVLEALVCIHERETGTYMDSEAFINMLKKFCPALAQ